MPPSVYSTFLAFVDTTRPWAASRADAQDGKSLLSLEVFLGPTFTISGHHYTAPHGINGHQHLDYVARKRAAGQAWQQVHEALCAQAPILRKNSHTIRDFLNPHALYAVWSVSVAGRVLTTHPDPHVIAQTLHRLAKTLEGLPTGTRRFSITGSDAKILTLYACSPEDALTLYYALVPLPILPVGLSEAHPLQAIRSQRPDPRES